MKCHVLVSHIPDHLLSNSTRCGSLTWKETPENDDLSAQDVFLAKLYMIAADASRYAGKLGL